VESTAKALKEVAKSNPNAIKTSVNNLFEKIKDSKWNSMPYTIDYIVKKWSTVKDESNENVKTINFLLENPLEIQLC
jgi:hypothetical protein